LNFLAHLHLSPNLSEVRVFNFTADGFKGQGWREGSTPAQRLGIDLHRFIDQFADAHPLSLTTKKLLYPKVGKYAPVALDLMGDFFLHRHWNWTQQRPAPTAPEFIQMCLDDIAAHQHLLVGRAAHMAPHLLRENWLLSYQSVEGLARAASGIAYRHRGAEAFAHYFNNALEGEIDLFEPWFLAMYDDLQQAARDFYQQHSDWGQLQGGNAI